MAMRVVFCSSRASPMVERVSKMRPLVHPCVLKAMKSTSASYQASTKFFEENKFVETPPRGWKERFIVIPDKKELEFEKQQAKMRHSQANNNHLSFDEFKKQRLMTFEKYTEMHQKYYDSETIRKGYELYCRGKYQGYLMGNQVIPGILL